MQFVSSDSCIAFHVPVSLDVHKSYFLHIISKFHVCKVQLLQFLNARFPAISLKDLHTVVFIPFQLSKVFKKYVLFSKKE